MGAVVVAVVGAFAIGRDHPVRVIRTFCIALCGIFAILVLYACYAGAGWRVFGFLRGYRTEEGLDDGRGIWLLAGLDLLNALPAWASTAYGGIVLSGMGV